MGDSPVFHRLHQIMTLTDRMTEEISKEKLAEVARILALQVGHYQRKFGVLAIDETLELLNMPSLTEEQAGWVADGLENLAAIIATAPDDKTPHGSTH
jgi:hypothetical protein